MKKFLLLFLSFCFCVMAATAFAAGEPHFDNMRTVLVVPTAQQSAEAAYMAKRLKEPFRIPYWDCIEAQEPLHPDSISSEKMRSLSDRYNADVVVVPVVRTWYWQQRQLFFRFDSETITDCTYYLSVYAYDRQLGTLKVYSSRGRKREPASILNNPYDILNKAMSEIMEKLPYKRIPTDIDAVRGSISPLTIKTTEGGAKTIDNQFPIAVSASLLHKS